MSSLPQQACEESLCFFEGCEKRVQIEFTGDGNLRQIPSSSIDAILQAAGCASLTLCSNERIDSYVLSESSLFVTRLCVILKTCGVTTVLAALPILLEEAAKVGCFAASISYSRSSFMFPDSQLEPYKKFDDEVVLLKAMFSGQAEEFSNPKKGLSWYMFSGQLKTLPANVLCPGVSYLKEGCNFRKKRPPKKKSKKSAVGGRKSKPTPSGTKHRQRHRVRRGLNSCIFEMCMFELDTDKMKVFFQDGEKPKSVSEVTAACGLDTLLPGFAVQGWCFSPCGYSCNAILDKFYFTVHISPEDHCSYVSFETNVMLPCAELPMYRTFTQLAHAVLALFRPRRFGVHMIMEPASLGFTSTSPDAYSRFLGSLTFNSYLPGSNVKLKLSRFASTGMLAVHASFCKRGSSDTPAPMPLVSNGHFSNIEDNTEDSMFNSNSESVFSTSDFEDVGSLSSPGKKLRL